LIDWETTVQVTFTGIISVFLALGILNLTVYFTGLYFHNRSQTEK